MIENLLLFNNLNARTRITEAEFMRIESILVKKQLRKKRELIIEGEISKNIYFITKGCLRSYSINKEGIAHVMQLALEDYWIGDLSSFITQTPGKLSIEAIEDTEVLQLSFADLEQLYIEIPALERFFRLLFQRALVQLQQRLDNSMSINAEERYQDLLSRQPLLVSRVPLIHIASYLGITPESLSRIRKRLVSPKK